MDGVSNKNLVSLVYIWIFRLASIIYWEGYLFSHRCSDTVFKSHVTVAAGVYLRALYSLLLICLSYFLPVPPCFCCLGYNWKLGIMIPLAVAVSAGRLLWLFEYFVLQMNVVLLFSFYKECYWNFGRDLLHWLCRYLHINFSKTAIFKILIQRGIL